jgi:hypothetical protein
VTNKQGLVLNMDIKNEDLTFVIQGPIIKGSDNLTTSSLVNEVEKFYPGSVIILSTWKEQDLSEFRGRVQLIESVDPGGQVGWLQSGTQNNVNRQIVSTINGLCAVKTRYAIKIRTDAIIKGDQVRKLLIKRPQRSMDTDFDILRELVIISNVTSYNPRFQIRRIHHPCDWFFAGLTQDLLNIWNIPLMPQEWFQWFSQEGTRSIGALNTDQDCRFDPEEYIWSQFLGKNQRIQFENSFDVTDANLQCSEKYIARNLQIYPNSFLGIDSMTHPESSKILPFSYSTFDYKIMARKYGIKINLFIDVYAIKVYLLRLKIICQLIWRKILH